MKNNEIPTSEDLLWPTLKALEARGGSGSIQELSEQVAADLELPDEMLDILHGKSGPKSEVDYRASWARTRLKFINAVDNTTRGIWTITEVGRGIQTDQKVRELVRLELAKRNKERNSRGPGAEDENDDGADEQDWEETLLSIVRRIEPPAFERLCQRILRESGFAKVEVTGRSGDGGSTAPGYCGSTSSRFMSAFSVRDTRVRSGARNSRL